MTRRILHFTLGPVQGFIGEARRLRDFWAGSFLLSLLSGHAMRALVEAGEKLGRKPEETIIFPSVTNDPLFKAIRGEGGEPYVGSLPNRFKADVTDIEEPGALCRDAIAKAWDEICAAVWSDIVAGSAGSSADGGHAAENIWNRQTTSFWDMTWVVGEDPGKGRDGSWLDRRKNWRSHYLGKDGEEGGDHCRMMGQYQEISGYHRIGEKRQQGVFWGAMREANKDSLDLQADERLCAIALVKRFFPVIAQKRGCIGNAMPFTPGGKGLNIRHWPSTSYVAALPWLRAAKDLKDNNAQSALYGTVKNAFGDSFLGEFDTPVLYGLPANDLFRLDGHLLHKDGIRAFAKERVKQGKLTDVVAKSAIKNATNALIEIARQIGGGKPRHASEFYAILRMDGDAIGKRLTDAPELIKNALANFTCRVTGFFEPGNDYLGLLVYAGGDDVLALLPVDTAIEAALALRKAYDGAFREAGLKPDAEPFTLSASIVYAHFKNPLTAVLRESEHQLDKIAKDGNGRNSLALAVLKPGGVAAQWVTLFDGDDGRITTLDELARQRFGAKQAIDGKKARSGISGGFFHGFRDRHEALFVGRDGKPSDVMKPDNLLPLLLKREIRDQFGGSNKPTPQEAAELADRVGRILRPEKRQQVNGSTETIARTGVAFDGGLMARFLSAEARHDLRPTETSKSGGDGNAQ